MTTRWKLLVRRHRGRNPQWACKSQTQRTPQFEPQHARMGPARTLPREPAVYGGPRREPTSPNDPSATERLGGPEADQYKRRTGRILTIATSVSSRRVERTVGRPSSHPRSAVADTVPFATVADTSGNASLDAGGTSLKRRSTTPPGPRPLTRAGERAAGLQVARGMSAVPRPRPFTKRCPTSAPDTAQSRTVQGILEAPFLAIPPSPRQMVRTLLAAGRSLVGASGQIVMPPIGASALSEVLAEGLAGLHSSMPRSC